jgi:hypothetical protein
MSLVPLVEGDPRLLNIYHAYVVNPGKHPTVKRSEAERFVRYLTEPKVQEWIGEFGRAKFGEPLFVPDARSGGQAVSRSDGLTIGRAVRRSCSRTTQAIAARSHVIPSLRSGQASCATRPNTSSRAQHAHTSSRAQRGIYSTSSGSLRARSLPLTLFGVGMRKK